MATEEIKSIFIQTGKTEKEVEKNMKNKELCKIWHEVILLSEVKLPCDKQIGNLLFELATNPGPHTNVNIKLIAQYIGNSSIPSKSRLEMAKKYLEALPNEQALQLDIEKFNQEIGVGIVVTDADVEKCVLDYFKEKDAELTADRHTIDKKQYKDEIASRLRFAESGQLFKIFDNKLKERLGPITGDDKKMIEEKNKKKAEQESKKDKKQLTEEQKDEPTIKIKDLIARDLADSKNTTETLKWKTDRFGNQVLTRFPPEPNGYLHIGHVKSLRFQFKVAEEYKGNTYLRFDDTNPQKEKIDFIDNIKENVAWLGHKPWKITYSSDYFDQLYEFAIVLIKKGKAFICHQSSEEMRAGREKGEPSPFRDRPIEENLLHFEKMKTGKYEEGKAMLRAKIDYTNSNTTLRDPVIYRILYKAHPHVGDKWCIYPLYDFTHCICDSLEGITHSVCTLEFEIRRDLYYWFLQELNLYRPFVWEMSRLNISNNVVSKRKVERLIKEGYVTGYDDPRLVTIVGMRRRGYTVQGINDFVDSINATRSGNEKVVEFQFLEHIIRRDLDRVCPRSLAVVDPVPVHITNLDDNFVQEIDAPDFPLEFQTNTNINKIFVDREDVRTEDHKEFFGMAPKKLVGLKYGFGLQKPCVVLVNEVMTDENKHITGVKVTISDTQEKPKFINWISEADSCNCEVRLYDTLFLEQNPNALDDFTKGINPNSLTIMKNAKMNKNLLGSNILDKYQFERIGFFALDQESDPKNGKYIWNRVCKLVEGGKKKALDKIAN